MGFANNSVVDFVFLVLSSIEHIRICQFGGAGGRF